MASGERARAAGRVFRLPDPLIDQIAAGEVVERPASVVKELVENALDAEAARVRVEIRDGGRSFIAVADDGLGMTPEDARLSIERHATSKIRESDDLVRIATFGFRGEALPSIAAVSRLRLRTRPRGSDAAFEIRVEAGIVVDAREAAGPEGTRVEVADLFAAIPARRKFLKTPATEWGRISEWLGRSALALPSVHFDARRDDRDAISWPAVSDPVDRIAAVLGEEDAAAMVPVTGVEGEVALSGFASRPDRHRPSMAGIHWYVNRRPVRDRLLQHALMEVYRDVLPRGRFPAAVLFLEIPRDRVDVNVHPAKWEVRFEEAPAVHRLVRRTLREAVATRAWMGGAAASGAVSGWQPVGRGAERGASDWVFAVRESPGAEAPSSVGALGDAAPAAAAVKLSELRLLGQFLATYLVLEAKDRLLLVDQHAAHERVLYERMRSQWRDHAVESQGLLVPATVELAPGPFAALETGRDAALKLGFDVEPFGEGTVAVRAVPALLAGRDPASLIRHLADELRAGEGGGGAPALDAADAIFASLACHAARRKGEALDLREQTSLLEALDAIPWAPTCPHGRPVAVPFDLFEIERRFGRR